MGSIPALGILQQRPPGWDEPMYQLAKFLDANQSSFTLLFDGDGGDPNETGLLPAANAFYVPTQFFNNVDVQVNGTATVPGQRERFGLVWMEGGGRPSHPTADVAAVSGKVLGYLSFNWNSRRNPHPQDALISALREVQSPNLAISPFVLLECLFITSVGRSVADGTLQTANWLPVLDEMRPVLQSQIVNLVGYWMRGPALLAKRYRDQNRLDVSGIVVNSASLDQWIALAGQGAMSAFQNAERADSGIIDLFFKTSASLWAGNEGIASPLARALLPIAQWRNMPPLGVVPGSLQQMAEQFAARQR